MAGLKKERESKHLHEFSIPHVTHAWIVHVHHVVLRVAVPSTHHMPVHVSPHHTVLVHHARYAHVVVVYVTTYVLLSPPWPELLMRESALIVVGEVRVLPVAGVKV